MKNFNESSLICLIYNTLNCSILLVDSKKIKGTPLLKKNGRKKPREMFL